MDSNSTSRANLDFTFVKAIADLVNYKDSGKVISVRIYQLATATEQSLTVDLYEVRSPLLYSNKYNIVSV